MCLLKNFRRGSKKSISMAAPKMCRAAKTRASPVSDFRGVGKWLESLLDEDENLRGREELEKVFSARDCADCKGSRLRPESRAVKINGMSISDYARLSLENAEKAFREDTTDAERIHHCGTGIAGNPRPHGVPVECRSRISFARPSLLFFVRGRGAANTACDSNRIQTQGCFVCSG